MRIITIFFAISVLPINVLFSADKLSVSSEHAAISIFGPDKPVLERVLSTGGFSQLLDAASSVTASTGEDGDVVDDAKMTLLFSLEARIRISYARGCRVEPAELATALSDPINLMNAAASHSPELHSMVRQWAALHGLLVKHIDPTEADALARYIASFGTQEMSRGAGASAEEPTQDAKERETLRVLPTTVPEDDSLGLPDWIMAEFKEVVAFEDLTKICTLERTVFAYLGARIDCDHLRKKIRPSSGDEAYVPREALEAQKALSERLVNLLNELMSYALAGNAVGFDYLASQLGMPLHYSKIGSTTVLRIAEVARTFNDLPLRASYKIFIRTLGSLKDIDPFVIDVFRKIFERGLNDGSFRQMLRESSTLISGLPHETRKKIISEQLDRLEESLAGLIAKETLNVADVKLWFESELCALLSYELWPQGVPIFGYVGTKILETSLPRYYSINIAPFETGDEIAAYKQAVFGAVCAGGPSRLFIDKDTTSQKDAILRLAHGGAGGKAKNYIYLWLLLDFVQSCHGFASVSMIESYMKELIPGWEYELWREDAFFELASGLRLREKNAPIYDYLLSHLPPLPPRRERELQTYVDLIKSTYTYEYWQENGVNVTGSYQLGEKETRFLVEAVRKGNVETNAALFEEVTSLAAFRVLIAQSEREEANLVANIAQQDQQVKQIMNHSLIAAKKVKKGWEKKDPFVPESQRVEQVVKSREVTKAVLGGQEKANKVSQLRIAHLRVAMKRAIARDLQSAYESGDVERFDELAQEYNMPLRLSAAAQPDINFVRLGRYQQFLHDYLGLATNLSSEADYFIGGFLSFSELVARYQTVPDDHVCQYQLLILITLFSTAHKWGCSINSLVEKYDDLKALWGTSDAIDVAHDQLGMQLAVWQEGLVAIEQRCGIVRSEQDDVPSIQAVLAALREPVAQEEIDEDGDMRITLLNARMLKARREEWLGEYKQLRTLMVVGREVQSLLLLMKEEQNVLTRPVESRAGAGAAPSSIGKKRGKRT